MQYSTVATPTIFIVLPEKKKTTTKQNINQQNWHGLFFINQVPCKLTV
jgi:hypothetical protein